VTMLPITVAIPTYRRGAILLQTIATLLELDPAPSSILVVDQTEEHPAEVEKQLRRIEELGRVRIIRLPTPSIPHAMNVALLEARTPLVLFLDDDIAPSRQLAAAHVAAHEARNVAAVVGQILQPGEAPQPVTQADDPLQFRFHSSIGAATRNVMAGNLSVARHAALEVGGFDENFVGAAYRFETDFAYRLADAGHQIWFEPEASLRHLKLATGGLRAFGEHLTSAGPEHSVGDYYFALGHVANPIAYSLRRLRQNVFTRYHLRKPWTIPTKIVGEVRGMFLARRLQQEGPRLLAARPAGIPESRDALADREPW
jgi:GT2 family glycosyltransferase